MKPRLRLLLPLMIPLLVLLWAGCAMPRPESGDVSGGVSGAALTGQWGGEHAGLSLSSSGGSIQYDCAHGTLDVPVVPDARGAFRVTGRHVREHGGPEQAGEQLPSQAALYEGSIAGDRMQLRVRAGADTLGPFLLQRGADARVFRCL